MHDTALAWIESFVRYLSTERRLSAHTAVAYRHDLEAFVAYVREQSLEKWREVDPQHLRGFAAASHRRGIAPRSIQRRLSSLRSFFQFLIREQQLDANPGVGIRAPKLSKRLPNTLDADQMARLLDFRADERLDSRDKAIMELFYSSGLRLAELAGLNRGDIDLSDRTVRAFGKGRKERIVPVGQHALRALQAWLQERTAMAKPEEAALFIGRHGARLGVRGIQKRVDRWAKLQGLGQHVHPHMFRHSFASHLLESSQDLRGVQELLGHANISTTQVYTHLDFQHLAKIYDETHPRARRKTSTKRQSRS